MITSKNLLEAYKNNEQAKNPEHIVFQGVGDQDVYNITAPFKINKTVIAGRVEARDSEESQIMLFEETDQKNVWRKIEESFILKLQDPFYTKIQGKIILGGVEVFFDTEDSHNTKWRTVFYEILNEKKANQVFEGPIGMKDLRLKETANGEILVLTRPQGEKGGRGKIGFLKVSSLAELSIEKIEAAPLLKNQFIDEEWGGANEIHLLNDGRIGVLGHIANFDSSGDRHYYAMAFLLDEKNQAINQAKIIAERKNFLDGPTKREDLQDVVFSGGLKFENNRVLLYAGISDAHAQKIEIENPFD